MVDDGDGASQMDVGLRCVSSGSTLVVQGVGNNRSSDVDDDATMAVS